MSVINKMLKDLDKRGGLGPRNLEDGLRDMERVAPAVPAKRPWGRISAWIIVAGLAGVTAWYVLQPAPRQTATARKPEPVAAPKPAVVATAPVSTETKREEARPAPAIEPAAAKVEAPAPAKVESSPKLEAPPPPKAEPPAPAKAEAPKLEPPKVAKAEAPSAKLEPPKVAKAEAPSAKLEPPKVAKAEAPSAKLEPPKVAKAEAPSAKLEAPKMAKAEPPPAPKPEKAKPETVVAAAAPAPAPEKPKPQPVAAAIQPAAPPAQASAPAVASSPMEPRVSIARADRNLGTPRATAEYRSANDLLAQGRVDAALARYADALRSDPRHVPARQSLIVLLLDQGRVADAQNTLREGIGVIPQNTAWPMLLARLQVEGGDVTGALETLQNSMTQAEGQAEYHAFLATLLQMQSRHKEAIVHYETSVRLGPPSARWLTGLAISLEEERRVAEARDAYRRALAVGGLSADLEAFAERRLKQLQ